VMVLNIYAFETNFSQYLCTIGVKAAFKVILAKERRVILLLVFILTIISDQSSHDKLLSILLR